MRITSDPARVRPNTMMRLLGLATVLDDPFSLGRTDHRRGYASLDAARPAPPDGLRGRGAGVQGNLSVGEMRRRNR